jgi:hypothetical protein
MPTSDPETRSMTSANSNDAVTSIKLFISRTDKNRINFLFRLEAGYCPPFLRPRPRWAVTRL